MRDVVSSAGEVYVGTHQFGEFGFELTCFGRASGKICLASIDQHLLAGCCTGNRAIGANGGREISALVVGRDEHSEELRTGVRW